MGKVSKPFMTKLSAGKLAPAFGADGWADLDHPLVVEWLAKRGVEPTAVRPAREKRRAKPLPVRPAPKRSDRPPPPKAAAETPPRATAGARRSAPPPEELAAPDRATSPKQALAYIAQLADGLDIENLPQLTLQELIERFGTEARFRDLLDARKRIGEIIEKDLKNEETTGRLIDRGLVKTHVIGLVDAVLKELFRDAATTIARTVYGMARGGKSVEEAETTVRDIISSHVKDVKARTAKALRGG